MNELRPGLPPLPPKMQGLAIDKRGFPVPYFVAVINGEPDHRIAEKTAFGRCMSKGLCWICGTTLGVYKSFVTGPMCGINRISSEPASHLECARYAARACPFLTKPHARRREAGMPDNWVEPGGMMLRRNPGVALIWTTRSFRRFRVGGDDRARDGILLDLGPPESLEWYAEGRPATHEEVVYAIDTGLPELLATVAEGDIQGLQDINQRADHLRAMVARQFAAEAAR